MKKLYWLMPLLISNLIPIIIVAMLYFTHGFSYWYLLIFIPSIITSVLLGGKLRKKMGEQQ